MAPAKPAFPELHPLVYPEMQIVRRANKVQVIRHDEIVSHQPSDRFCAPDVGQGLLDGGVCHPRHGILAVNRDEENVGLADENVRTRRRGLSTDVVVDAFTFGHKPNVAPRFS